MLFRPAAMIQKQSQSIRGRAGFTLIETLIVLALMGVLLTLTAPTLVTIIHRTRIEGSAQQVAILLRQMRFEAIKRSTPVEVRLSDPTTAATAIGPMVRLATGVTFDAALDADCVDTLSLQPSGAVNAIGAFCLSDRYGNVMKIEVRPKATAQVRLLKKENGTFRIQGEGGQAWQFN